MYLHNMYILIEKPTPNDKITLFELKQMYCHSMYTFIEKPDYVLKQYLYFKCKTYTRSGAEGDMSCFD